MNNDMQLGFAGADADSVFLYRHMATCTAHGMGSPCPICHCLPGTLPLHQLLAGELTASALKSHFQQYETEKVLDWQCWEKPSCSLCLSLCFSVVSKLGAAVCWSA